LKLSDTLGSVAVQVTLTLVMFEGVLVPVPFVTVQVWPPGFELTVTA
jgi:hypothetical protein